VRRFIRLGILLISLALAPATARAEWQVKPFGGVTFGGSTTLLIDLDEQAGKPKLNLGVSGLWLGNVFGLEGDVATIGITDFAQGELGDIVYVEPPESEKERIASDHAKVQSAWDSGEDGRRWRGPFLLPVPGTKAGDVVAILGPGVRGLSAVAACKEAGASFVLVTGAGERDAPRLEMARRFGADLVVDVTEEDPVRALRSATGGGLADVVLDVTAKAPAAFGQAVRLVRPGGTVVVAGTRGSDDTPGFSPDHLVYKEARVIGALGVDTTAYRAALELLATGRYPFAELPRAVVDLDGLASLLELLAGDVPGTPPVHGVLVP